MRKKTRLNYQDREMLYSKLLEESGLLEKSKQCKAEVNRFVVYLYKKYIVSEEERRILLTIINGNLCIKHRDTETQSL